MLRFFRTIRKKLIEEDNVRTYLLYAIGEILLVVIGILIALQVNNWNEERKDIAREQEYLERLLIEAQNNVSNMEEQSRGYLYKARYNQSVVNYLSGFSDYVIEDSSSSYNKLPYFIQAVITGRSVYNEIVSSGNLTILRDDTLRTLLDAAYASTDFASIQTEYWRDLSNTEAGLVRKYRVTKNTFNADTVYTLSELEIDRMKGDEEIINMIEYWAGAQIIFYDGFQNVKRRHQEVADRIKYLMKN
jgi:hypothetical protein